VAFAKGNKIGNRFPKGTSGNPGGRPKSKLLSEAYKKILEQEIPAGKDKGKTYAEVIAEALAKESRKGKVHAASEIADRTEGSPRQAYEVKLSIMDELPTLIEEGKKRVAARKKK
jgi:hypothetical protein